MTERSAPRIFGFAQLDLPGALPLADGRYVVRDEEGEHVLVLETRDARPAPRRRQRRPRRAEPERAPATVPLTRATVVLATRPFADKDAASEWLRGIAEDERALEALLTESAALLDRALYVHAVVSEDPHQAAISAEGAAAARIGFGSGEQMADGEWTSAVDVDPSPPRGSQRRQRAEELRPQERTAAVLGGRERLDACETLLLRARSDLDAGRGREAALQLRVGLEALLRELPDALSDPDHTADMASLESRRQEAVDAAEAALLGDLAAAQITSVQDLLHLCERVIRRRRVLAMKNSLEQER